MACVREGKDHVEDIGVDGRIILNWVLYKYNGMACVREGKDHVEDIGVDGRITLNWILNRYNGMAWILVAQNVDK
jgi:hypothetical protein